MMLRFSFRKDEGLVGEKLVLRSSVAETGFEVPLR